jgi:hypothetical protein
MHSPLVLWSQQVRLSLHPSCLFFSLMLFALRMYVSRQLLFSVTHPILLGCHSTYSYTSACALQ